MKRKTLLILSAAISFLVLQLATTSVHTNDLSPRAGKTGAPGETTCAKSGCHTDHLLNSGPGSVTITYSDPDSEYVPGQTYTLGVTVSQQDYLKYGFEITAAVAVGGAGTGTWVITDAISTGNANIPATEAVQGRKYIGHHKADSSAAGVFTQSWSVNWIAPATCVGDIRFYAAGNAVDGNNIDTVTSSTSWPGDWAYTTNFTIHCAPLGIYEIDNGLQPATFVFGNPVSDQLNVKYRLEKNNHVVIKMFNGIGELVQVLLDENEMQGVRSHSFDVSQLTGGIYFLEFTSGSFSRSEKVFVE